jgi:hypothetical protein
MLTDLIIFAIICIANAFAIIGFFRACQYDTYGNGVGYGSNNEHREGEIVENTKMIFWKMKFWCEKKIGIFWSKPICTCPTCMASVHGIIPFLVTESMIHGLSHMTIIYWAFYTLTLAGVTTYINDK